MYRNILVAYDGTEGAKAALAQAVDIARKQGTALTLVRSVAERAPLEPIATQPPDPESAARARRSLEDVIGTLDPELGASPWVVAGPAGEAILAVARDIGADLIVTGSRGRGTVASALLGSVSSKLVQDARFDVLVVHPRRD